MSAINIEVNEAFIKSMEKYREPDKTLGLIGASAKNVVVFSERMIGIRLYAWQVYFLTRVQEAMESSNDKLVGTLINEFCAITSRQIGKSTALAILGLWSAVFNKKAGTISNNTIYLIISASDVQAKKLLYEMKKFLRLGDTHLKLTYLDDEGKPLFGEKFFSDLLDDNEPNNTTTITFKPYKEELHGEYLLRGSKNGSVIKSYPPTSSVLGETATIVGVDEAGKSDKISDQFFYDYLYPVGNSTNAIRLYTSTPWVTSGFFYRMVDPDDIYSDSPVEVCLFTIDAIKIENPSYYNQVMKTVNQLNADGKQDEVQRAYYCRFVKGDDNYFAPEDVLDSFDKELEMVDSFKLPCDMGVDFGGQVKSKTVITISYLREDGQVIRLYRKVYPVGKDNDLLLDISTLKDRFNIQRIIPDDCPQGDYLIRQMKDKGWDIHPMNFRSEKVKKYGAFRSMLKKHLIKTFEDDDLKTEMLALEFSQGSRQSLIQHAAGYSDDLIDSFLLSVYFFLQEESTFEMFDYYGDEE